MSLLVAQYQQGTITAPVNGDANDASVVVANENAIAAKHNSHDADATIHLQSSSLASRPAFGTAGRFWVTTDTPKRAYYDTGAAWQELGYLLANGTTAMTGPLGAVLGMRSSAGTTTIASATSGVAVTLFAAATGTSQGLYFVGAWINAGGAAQAAYAVFLRDGSTVIPMHTVNGANMTLTVSGANIQATQSVGALQVICYTYSFISFA